MSAESNASGTVAQISRLVAERKALQGHDLGMPEVERFTATLAALPQPPCSLLDVGCGTGVLADVAAGLGYDAQGIDTDPFVLEHMTAPSSVGSAAALPFADRSFDVTVACEVLEHLPVGVFEASISELARVARHQILITVPNEESLESASTRCPQCQATYSIHGHVRRFKRGDMRELVPGFEMTSLEEVGPYKVRHRSLEWVVRRRLLGRWPVQPGATCPQCGWQQAPAQTVKRTSSSMGRVLRHLAGFPRSRWWFVAKYERNPVR